MNNYDKIRSFCRIFRVILGTALLIAGFIFTADEQFYNLWFVLGLLPLIAGLANFCPLCLITKKCSI